MKNQSWLMLICCLGPLLFLAFGPVFGLSKETGSWVLIPIMLLFCFMMMGKGGGCCGGHQHKGPDTDKKEEKKHGCH